MTPRLDWETNQIGKKGLDIVTLIWYNLGNYILEKADLIRYFPRA